jgi:hypothetical protein
MKRYEQPIKTAPRDNAGLIGKAQAPHIERRGYQLRFGLQPRVKVRPGRLCSFVPVRVLLHKNSSRDLPTAILVQLNLIAPPYRPIHRCMKPSVSVCMKLTSAFSSSSESPSRPTNLVFMLSVDSGRGQHVVPSPASLVPQRRRTSRVL